MQVYFAVKKQTVIFLFILMVYFSFFMEYVAAFADWPVKGLRHRIFFFNLFLDLVVLHHKPALTCVTPDLTCDPGLWHTPVQDDGLCSELATYLRDTFLYV